MAVSSTQPRSWFEDPSVFGKDTLRAKAAVREPSSAAELNEWQAARMQDKYAAFWQTRARMRAHEEGEEFTIAWMARQTGFYSEDVLHEIFSGRIRVDLGHILVLSAVFGSPPNLSVE